MGLKFTPYHLSKKKLIRYPIPNSSVVWYVRHKQWLSKISRCCSHSYFVVCKRMNNIRGFVSFAGIWNASVSCRPVMKWSWKFYFSVCVFSFSVRKWWFTENKRIDGFTMETLWTIRYNPLITLGLIQPTTSISNDFHFYLARNWNFLRLSVVCSSMFVVHSYPIRSHLKES